MARTVAVAGIKRLVDVATRPQDYEFAPGLKAYGVRAVRVPDHRAEMIARPVRRSPGRPRLEGRDRSVE